MPEPAPINPPPAHRSKVGVGKLIVQGVALLVAIANHAWDLEFEFTETHAALLIGLLETVWQGKQHQTRKRLKRDVESPTGKVVE